MSDAQIVVVTTSVSGVSPTQTYPIPASDLKAPAGSTNVAAVITVPAYSVLLASTAFECPNVVLGLVGDVFEGASAPPPGATPPFGIPLRLTLINLSLSPPVAGGDGQGDVPTTPSTTATVGSTTTKDPIKTSSSANESPSPGLGTGAVAGVAIGCLLAGALIFAVVFFWLYRRKNTSTDGRPASTIIASDAKDHKAHLPRASSPAELHAPPTRAELPAQRPHAELSA